MKNFLLVVFILICISASAQLSSSVTNIPDNVKNTLHTLYPDASDVTWEQEKGFFIPVFMHNNAQTKMLIDMKGACVQTSTKIEATALPLAITSYIATNYPNQSVSDAEKLIMMNNSIRYEAIIAGNDLIFNSSGQFIKMGRGPLKQ